MLAELLTGAISAQVGGAEHIGTYVELQVLDWLKQIMGFPADASGILISGASMANFIGLTVARNAGAPVDIRKDGLQGSLPRMVLYTSAEAHSCHQKNAEVLGLGRSAIRFIPVDERYQSGWMPCVMRLNRTEPPVICHSVSSVPPGRSKQARSMI